MKTVFAIMIACLICGCVRCTPWKPVKEDAPLCQPHRVAVTKTRICYPPVYVVADRYSEWGWDVDGRIVQQHKVARIVDAYLESIGFLEKQHRTGSFSNGIQERVSAHRFFIVSLKPTIVIMTPYDFGTVAGKSTDELRSALSNKHLLSRVLVNGYHYGSSVPIEAKYQWFSPELKTGIRDVPYTNGAFRISHPAAVLTFGNGKTNGFYAIERNNR